MLPPLSTDQPCAKCGCTTITMQWMPRCRLPGPEIGPPMEFEERMVRTCSRCGFKWPEAPLTANPTD